MKSKFTPNSFTNFLYLWQRTLIKEIGLAEQRGMVKIANKTNHLTGVLWNGTWHLFLCLRDICYVFVESFKSNQSHNDKVKLTFIRFLSIMESIILSSKFYSAQNKKKTESRKAKINTFLCRFFVLYSPESIPICMDRRRTERTNQINKKTAFSFRNSKLARNVNKN